MLRFQSIRPRGAGLELVQRSSTTARAGHSIPAASPPVEAFAKTTWKVTLSAIRRWRFLGPSTMHLPLQAVLARPEAEPDFQTSPISPWEDTHYGNQMGQNITFCLILSSGAPAVRLLLTRRRSMPMMDQAGSCTSIPRTAQS